MMKAFNDGFYLQHVNNIVIYDIQNNEGWGRGGRQAIVTYAFLAMVVHK